MSSQGAGAETLFETGDVVRVATGPFSELTGRLTRLEAGSRVKVLLSILGAPTCPIGQVAAMGASTMSGFEAPPSGR
ncbi:MAG: transcription termination/antitermination protein NusG, partial [Alphaproteobacteria bacterium]